MMPNCAISLVAAVLAVVAGSAIRAPVAAGETRAHFAATQRLAQSSQVPDTSSRKPLGPLAVRPGPETKPPGVRPPIEPPKPRGIVCIGGRVSGRQCLCRSGGATKTASGVYVCRARPNGSDSSSGRGTRDDGARSQPEREREPRRAAPERRVPSLPALPPPAGPVRVAPGPPPRPDPLPLSAADIVVPAEIVATLPDATPQAVEDDVARTFNLVLVERLDIALIAERLVRYRIPDQRNVDAVVAALGGDARLAGPQPNLVYRNQDGGKAPADLQYAAQKLELSAAHEVARGKGAVVAVIDSGVDQRHPDLAGVVGEEIDVTGGSVATDVADPHGTAVAGIIAARGLVKGVAPMARVLSIKAFRPASSGAASISTTAMLVAGIDKAVGKGAQVLNMSFAGAEDALVHRLVKAASAKGVLMVAAAGNKGPGARPAYPAGYPEVLAVTATDADDRLYVKANRGSYVAMAAPGVDVLAPGAARSHQLQSGTSFAAAHVSGVLALLIERHPRITPAEASEALAASAVDLGRPGRDDEFGAGLISAAGALRRMGHVP